MKLSDILNEDVVDFAAKRREKEFIDKVGAMSDANRDEEAMLDLAPKENKLLIQIQQKYGKDMENMIKFLERPVMSGGFKSAHDLLEALQQWGRKTAVHTTRRRIQKAAADDNLFKQIQRYNALWTAISEQFPMEVIWHIPNIDDFEALDDLEINLAAARSHFLGK